MRVMVIMKATKGTESGQIPTTDEMDAMIRFHEESVNAGILVAADGLLPSSQGARIEFSGAEPRVIDGPFTETKELVAGYWILQVKSLAEAVAWAKRLPN
ncbi:MAG TPA: YciI family protein, partial [Longimicrobiales bacterium]